jgi:hypothetical protein
VEHPENSHVHAEPGPDVEHLDLGHEQSRAKALARRLERMAHAAERRRWRGGGQHQERAQERGARHHRPRATEHQKRTRIR